MATEYANGKLITNGLVLCLDAGDRNSYPSTGTTWTDVARRRTATLVNPSTPFWNSGNGGHFLSGNMGGFGDNSGRININNFPTDNINDCTIQCVFMYNSAQYQNAKLFAIEQSDGNLVSMDTQGIPGDGVRMATDGGGRLAISPVTQNVWNFASGVRDKTNGTMNISLNGGARITNSYGTSISTITSPTAAWAISREDNSGVVLWGRLAVILYYNRALSREEELINFNALRHRFRI